MAPSAKRNLLFPALLLVAVSCAQPHHDEKAPSAPEPTAAPLLVGLERAACFGVCPVYSVSVRRDGRVTYQGDRFVKVKGTATAQLSQQSLAELGRAVAAANLDRLAASYEHPSMSDRPTVTVSFARAGSSGSIRHNLGDETAPAALTELETRIDSITFVEQWTGTAAERLQHVSDWQ